MKRGVYSWTVALALILGALPAAAQQVSEQDAQQAGQSILDAWNKTSQQRDAAGQAALFTEDATRVSPQGIISGRAAIESLTAESFKTYTPDSSTLERVVMIGNGVMLRTGSWSGTYNSPSGPLHMKGYWSDTDVRDGNTWKIRQLTYNSTPPPPEAKK